MSDLWSALFKALDVKFMVASAYHPQSDGQSERTNQTVEIALRYFYLANLEADWSLFLSHLRATLNNSVNATTGKAPNKMLIKCRTNDPISLLNDLYATDLEQERSIHRRDAKDAIHFANVESKLRYDSNHKRLLMKEGDHAYLRLHDGYNVKGITRKLEQQRVGPFLIFERIGNLAYRLKFPSTWKIHDVVSVAQLKPADHLDDPYGRRTDDQPGPEPDEFVDTDAPTYETEALVDRRVRKYG